LPSICLRDSERVAWFVSTAVFLVAISSSAPGGEGFRARDGATGIWPYSAASLNANLFRMAPDKEAHHPKLAFYLEQSSWLRIFSARPPPAVQNGVIADSQRS
jgi:hypothetical protein